MNRQQQKGFSYHFRRKKLLLSAGIVILFGIGWYVFATRNKHPVYPSSLSLTSALSPTDTYTFSPSSVIASSNPTVPILEWQTYTDATLGATFEYPTTWKLIHTKSDPSQTGVGRDY